MSMLTGQIEKLRAVADLYETLNRKPAMAALLRDAADTIEQLRDMAQKALLGRECAREDITELAEQDAELNRENERMRELHVAQSCRNAHEDSVEDLAVWFECSECGRTMMGTVPRFCPWCGRRVVK